MEPFRKWLCHGAFAFVSRLAPCKWTQENVVAYAFDPSTWGQKQEDICDSEANLCSIASSRIAGLQSLKEK